MLAALRSAVAVLFFMLVPCLATAHEGNQIVVGGGGDAIIAFFAPVSEVFQDESGFRLFLNVTSPAKALFDLSSDNIDIATGTSTLKEMIAEVGKKIKIEPSVFQETVIGVNFTRVIVHKSNPITELTKSQLKDILTGKITNWKVFGGPDKDIALVWSPLTTSQNDLVTKEIMDGQPLAVKKVAATDFLSMRRKVMENQGGIGFVPEALLTSLIKAPESPKLKSQVIAITKGKPGPQEKKLLDFLVEIATVF